MNSLPTPDEDDPLEELTSQAADEFIERFDRGEKPDVEEAAEPSGDRRRPAAVAAGAPGHANRDQGRGRSSPIRIGRPTGRFRDRPRGRPRRHGRRLRGGAAVAGRRVALEVLPFAAMLDPNRLQRYENEARAAACLHHGNIVPILGVGWTAASTSTRCNTSKGGTSQPSSRTPADRPACRLTMESPLRMVGDSLRKSPPPPRLAERVAHHPLPPRRTRPCPRALPRPGGFVSHRGSQPCRRPRPCITPTSKASSTAT